jgi:hypothetical protein
MTPMTTLIVVYAIAAVALFGIFAGIPMWMIHRHPDTAPHDKLPEYLRADWENLPAQALAGAGQKAGR